MLVIDGDHRRGALMQNASAKFKLGMTDLLSGRVTSSEVIQTDSVTKVDFISAGKACLVRLAPMRLHDCGV